MDLNKLLQDLRDGDIDAKYLLFTALADLDKTMNYFSGKVRLEKDYGTYLTECYDKYRTTKLPE